MKYFASSRRMFLLGAGQACLSVPFLPSLLPRSAVAGTPTQSLKYIQVCSNFCTTVDRFLPFPASHEPVSPVVSPDGGVTKIQSLAEIIAASGEIAPGLRGADWEALAPYLTLIHGSNLSGAPDHAHSCTTGTTASTPHDLAGDNTPANDNPFFKYSLDWFAERKLDRGTSPFSALRTHFVYRHAQFDEFGQPLPQADGSDNGYLHYEYPHYCFGGPDERNPGFAVLLPEMYDVAELELKLAQFGDAGAADPRRDARLKLVDAVRGDYRRIIGNQRLSQVDRQRLEDAVELWNEAENRMIAGAQACAGGPEIQGTVPDGSGGTRASWLVYHQYAMDLVTYALACGAAPVVTYVLNHTADDYPNNFDEYYNLHSVEHDSANIPGMYEAAVDWRLARMAYFANRLRVLTDETGASLLDTSLLYWSHEFSNHGHVHAGHTSILIGNAGGRLQSGSFVDVAGDPDTSDPYYRMYSDGVPLNRICITILKALGLSTEEIEVSGEPGFGEYGDGETESNDHREGASAGWSNAGRQQFETTEEKRKALPILNPS